MRRRSSLPASLLLFVFSTTTSALALAQGTACVAAELTNSDFEDGLTGWTSSGSVSTSTDAFSGSGAVELTDSGLLTDPELRQDVFIPEGDSATLTFAADIPSPSTGSVRFDVLVDGFPVETIFGSGATAAYTVYTVPVDFLADGETHTIEFRLDVSSIGGIRSATIDNVAFVACPVEVAVFDLGIAPGGGTRTSAVRVTDPGLIADLDIAVNLRTFFYGALSLRLRHVDSGTVINLVNRPPNDTGSCTSDNPAFILDDEATGGSIQAVCDSGNLSPPSYAPLEALSAFDGLPAAGVWQLELDAASDSGEIVDWTLLINEPLPPMGEGAFEGGFEGAIFEGALSEGEGSAKHGGAVEKGNRLDLANGQNYLASVASRAFTATNLDADDSLDFITAQGGSVILHLGNDDGTLQGRMFVDADNGAIAVTTADLNGDTAADAIAAGGAGVSILLGNGDGTLEAPALLTTGDEPTDVAAGFITNDANVDLAVAQAQDDTVELFSGLGDGAFGAIGDVPVGRLPQTVAIADLDTGGADEIVTAGFEHVTVVSQQVGSFAVLNTIALDGFIRDLAVADLDGAGGLDLVLVNASEEKLVLLYGNGDGTFQAPIEFDTESPVFKIDTGLVDNDEFTDVFTALPLLDSIAIYFGLGAGGLTTPDTYTALGRPVDVFLGDIEPDGDIDLATLKAGNNQVEIRLQRGPFPPEGEGMVEGEGMIAEGEGEGAATEGEGMLQEGEGAEEGAPAEGEGGIVIEGMPPEGEGAATEGEGMPQEGEGAEEGAPAEGEGEGGVCLPSPIHSADTDASNTIELSELLRVIQFFNVGSLGCDPATEDGYAPGAPDQSCCPHDSDFVLGTRWSITLLELLRTIQLFNSAGYIECASQGTDDGYCPVARQ